jgi:Diiron non-heme beta-hydroxylase N-terminal domain
MSADLLYLRSNVQVEPLIYQWYAWPHLIPPSTASRNITERHFQIMNSYVASPQLHAEAVKNPKMLGGPFVDYATPRVDEIAALLESTKANASDLIALSAAIAALDAIIEREAKGYSLKSLYAKIPVKLRGYVELVYDLHNQPSFRFIEPLLYNKYYDPTSQSLMLSMIVGDDRPFVLSTPRLEASDSLHLRIPFQDERVDWLFRAKSRPQHWSDIAQRFEQSRPIVESNVLIQECIARGIRAERLYGEKEILRENR